MVQVILFFSVWAMAGSWAPRMVDPLCAQRLSSYGGTTNYNKLRYQDPFNWVVFEAIFKNKFTQEEALSVSQQLLEKLDEVLDFLQTESSNITLRSLKPWIEKVQKGDLLEGTNFTLEGSGSRSTTLPILGWVKTDEELVQASEHLARQSKLLPGKLRLPVLEQKIDGKRFFLHFEEIDKNRVELYVDYLLLMLEEHYHLAQYLRIYGGLNGTAANISDWAHAAPVNFLLDLECDVFAHLKKKFPPLGSHWQERYSRRSVIL